MALKPEQIEQIKLMMDDYIEKHRPEKDLRSELDLGWRLDRQSVLVFQIMPDYQEPGKTTQYEIAKATWVKTEKEWHIFWKRATGKWDRYQPLPSVVNLQRFVIELEKDPYHCFWG